MFFFQDDCLEVQNDVCAKCEGENINPMLKLRNVLQKQKTLDHMIFSERY